MRILVFTQYFTPEVTAASGRVQPIAELLARRGHDIEVICEVPNHPTGEIAEGFRGRPLVRVARDGFTVRHVWVKASPRKTTRTRLAFYGSYAAMAAAAGALTRRADVLFASSPPLPVAAAAALAARRHRAPWVLDVRDPWPEAAVALGELRDPRVIAAMERLERHLYRDAAAIVTVTEPFRAGIVRHVEDPDGVHVVPNGTTRAWLEAGEGEPERAELGMPADRFVWTYAGNVGIAQGLDAALDAAASLGDGFQLQVVGAGPRLAGLRERAASLPSGAVAFRGLVPPQLAARYLRASDATLVPLGASPALAKFVPSKLYDCCAIGRPVVLAAAGESRRLAEGSGAALAVAPEDPDALAAALRRLAGDPGLRRRLGEAGRAFAAAHLRERQVERIERVLGAAAGAA